MIVIIKIILAYMCICVYIHKQHAHIPEAWKVFASSSRAVVDVVCKLLRALKAVGEVLFRGNHLSNITCLTGVLFNSDR